jgi:hypothetical protein
LQVVEEEKQDLVNSIVLQVVEEEKQDLVNRQQDMELSYENKLLALREQLLSSHRTGIDEDIDIINLQRSASSLASLLQVRNLPY